MTKFYNLRAWSIEEGYGYSSSAVGAMAGDRLYGTPRPQRLGIIMQLYCIHLKNERVATGK